MKIRISSDSTCDLSPELVRRYGIEIVPLSVTLGEDIYKDGVEMDVNDIYAYVDSTGNLPKTSAVNIADYGTVFRRLTKDGGAVIHFCISADFSSSYQNACAAAEQIGNVWVMDSRNLSTGQGLMVLRAADLAAEGADPETICAECAEMADRVDASFVIDRLDYLYKGGRCSALSAFGANLLRLKPCIEVRDGRMLPEKKYRGAFERVIPQYIADRLADSERIDRTRVFITHTRCSDACVRNAVETVRRLLPDLSEVLETTAGATVTTHCGPNTLGVLFVRKKA